MLSTVIIFLLSFLSKSIAQTDIQGQEPYYYGNTLFYKPHSKISCDHLEDKLPEDFYYVGINPSQYLNGAACGDCIVGVVNTTSNGNIASLEFKGKINNKFAGLYYGDIAIERENNYGDALWPTKWKYIKCPYISTENTQHPIEHSTSKPTTTPAGKTCQNAIMHANKLVCCPKSCKICGEKNCNLNRESEGNCCYTGIIRLHNRSCEKFPAPCVI